MDVESLAKQLILQGMTPEQQKAVLESIRGTMAKSRELQKQKVGEQARLVIEALKKIEGDIKSRYDEVGNKIEQRVASIKDGKDGRDGTNGRDGRAGRDGSTGPMGPKGADGRNGVDGQDGVDGVSVTDAHIDFDGSLIISLSSGRTINVGEVVAPDLAEKIKVITNGGGTSQTVLDTLASLQTQINNLIPSQTGNAGKYLTTNGSALSWASVAGGLNYQGTWNASTNTPTLVSSTGTNGYYYVVSVAGSTNLNGITDWQVGDWLIFNGSTWQKIDQSEVGDVSGPSSSTDNAIARFDGTTGKVIQNSGVTIDDSANVASARSIQFSGAIPATKPIGTMWFDSSSDTLNFQQNNVTQQIGEETFIYGRASEAITNGQVITVSGAYGTTGYVTFEPAPIGTTDPSHIIGLATENIAKNSFGRITCFGIVHDLSTSPGFADGDTLWYDPTVLGGYTKTRPVAPNIKVQIGVITKAAGGTNGSIQVKVFEGPTINDISDAQVTSPTAAQLLSYNSTSGYWKNTSLTAGTGVSVGTNANGTITVTNSAPDQTVSLTGAGTTTVTGTYPTFTVTSNDQYTGTVTSVGGTGTVNGISLSGTVTSSGNLTLGGTLSGVSLATQVSGTLPIANGGSGQTTAQTAMNAFAGAVTSGLYLRGNGTNVVMAAIQPGDVPTLNQNTTGTASNVTGTVAIANGGTGQTTATAAFNALAPSQTSNSGKYLTTDGTNTSWATVNAGASLSNDTTTSTNLYPLFAAATSGTPTTLYTGNAKLLYKPSTGELNSTVHRSSNGIHVNSQTVSADYTIASGDNAVSGGPMTVASGVTVTVSSGSVWTVT